MKVITIISAILVCVNLCSQTSVNYGFADNTVTELSEFEYYRGEWKITMEKKLNDGTFEKLNFEATIKAEFLEDHKTFQTQFIGSRGFFSTDVRTYNTKTKQWEALFINAKAQRWHKFTSKIIEGKMTTLVKGGYSGKEEFDVKAVDTVISETEYLRNIYHSTDQMVTWKHIYRISAKRI